MAKKIVRGITDVKTITNQDFDTNNVNDLLSDGQYNYIHRKKGKTEEYHNLTDNIKTLSSDNTELLSVTNYNKTTNTATLHPKHDAQKEQLLGTTHHTVSIQHGTNGTAEKTTVDTNPLKVLEHENLISDSEYITLNHQTGENKTHIKTEKLKQELQQLHQTKQDVLTAGEGITIEGQTISATGGGAPVEGATVSFKRFGDPQLGLYAIEYTTLCERGLITQFTFQCPAGTREFDITGALKDELLDFILNNGQISSGAITITATFTPTGDDMVIKLVNSNYATENVSQQETFTFFDGNINV